MACPDCGSPAGDLRFATSVETHGLDCGPYETFNEEFIVCRECGGRYDVCEWDGTQELREISMPSDRIETAAVRINLLSAGLPPPRGLVDTRNPPAAASHPAPPPHHRDTALRYFTCQFN